MKGFPDRRVLMLLENNPFRYDPRPRAEALALLGRGYSVSVISPRPKGAKFFEIDSGVHVYHFPAPPEGNGFVGYLMEYLYATFALLVLSILVFVREGFDILHAHNPPDTLFVIAGFYRLLGRRFVFDHHDLAPEMYLARYGAHSRQWIYRTLLWLEQMSCRMANHVIATNGSYRTIELTRDHVLPERVTIVRNGPDPDVIKPLEPVPGLRDKAGTILCYLGKMAPQDGVDYLIRALTCLLGLGKGDWYCVLVGDGDAVPRLKLLAGELSLTNHLCFTGLVPPSEVPHYLSAADICVSPEPSNSYNDRSTTIKAMEYMAVMKPTVAFDLPEHRATLGEAAVYARPNDELDFARQIAMLIDDPARRLCMGRIGRERIERELAWSHQKDRLLEAYARLESGFKVESHSTPNLRDPSIKGKG